MEPEKLRLLILLLLGMVISGCRVNLTPLSPTPSTTPPVMSTSLKLEEQATATYAPPTASPVAEATITPDRTLENNQPLAARVNGEPIFLDIYLEQTALMAQILQTQGIDLEQEPDRTTLAQIRQQVLEGLIEQQLITQAATKLNLTVNEATVEAQWQASLAQKQDQVSFAAWLTANRLTDETFKETLRSQLTANRLFEQITGPMPEIAPQIQLAYIRVADEAMAWAIIEQLKKGMDFTALAQIYAINESNPAWFPRGAGLVPTPVETTAFALQPGQISGPIADPESAFFYIIKLKNRAADRPLSQEMRQRLKKEIFNRWLEKQRSLSVIERFVAL